MDFQKVDGRVGDFFLTACLASLFFISGFSALLYQVIWQRMLGLFSGVDVYSVTIIVSSFMLGMGFGSMAGGYIADRLSRRLLVAMFAASEFLIAVFALGSKWFYYDILYQMFPGLGSSLLLLSVVLFFSLLLPAFFMGITLPLLSRALIERPSEAALKISLLYSLNTLGAAFGALISAVFIIRNFGFESGIKLGSALNFTAMLGALAALFFSKFSDVYAQDTEIKNELVKSEIADTFSFHVWISAYLLSGFIALGLEILWFRVMGVILKSTAFTFGILLFIYLFGLALGGLFGLFFAPKSRNPDRIFLLLQAMIALFSVVSLSVFVGQVDSVGFLRVVWHYLAAPINFPFAFHFKDITQEFMAMYFFVAPLLIMPATFLMGMSFPYLQKVVQTDLAGLGRRVGWIQSANILGSTLGSVIVGLLLLRFFGTTGSMKIILLLGVVYWWLFCRTSFAGWKQTAAFGFGCFLVFFVIRLVPDPQVFWAKLHGTAPSQKSLHVEDNSGLSFIKMGQSVDLRGPVFQQGQAFVFIGGATESDIPFGGQHTALGLTASMLHPAPEDILIVGFGSGDTVFSAGGRPETKNIYGIEILCAQFRNLRELHAIAPYKAFEQLFGDPRFKLECADARTWLMRSNRKFDIIEGDPLRPNMAYAGNLYSAEYFELLRNHLKAGGFAVSWMPSGRTIKTFRSVFPYTLNIGNWMFIGSNEPIAVDRDAVMKRIGQPAVQEYYKNTAVDPVAVVQAELDKIVDQPQEQWRGIRDVNSDLFPRDEYEKPDEL